MIIRPATENDVEIITELFFKTVTEVNAKDYNEGQIRAWSAGASHRERWLTRINTQHFLVALDEQQLYGFASLTEKGYLDLMFVGKDFQGQGIGKKLLTELEKIAETLGIDRIESDVSISARPFFERNGYRIITVQKVIIREVELLNYKMIKEK